MDSSGLSQGRSPGITMIRGLRKFAGLPALAVLAGCGTAAGGGTFAAMGTPSGRWTWQTGAASDPVAVYGVLGQPAAANTPGGRELAAAWKDSAGNFWLFGGFGLDSTGATLWLNDLWKYSAGQWTWIGGSDIGMVNGVYGTQGLPSPNNVPGARESAVSWTDTSGSLWLFGGTGVTAAGSGQLNDLWKYHGGEWTWIAGSRLAGQAGSYGTLGIPDPNNAPGARQRAVGWADSSGNLWLFGGFGFDGSGTSGFLNDLWEYTGGRWVWVSGSKAANQPGVYGTKGVASSSTVPGARFSASAWTDSSGTLWLFGGFGAPAAGANGLLSDLWKYSNGKWTWVSGSTTAGQSASYGAQGVAAAGNDPGARMNAQSWTDAAGHFWLFGGQASAPGATVVAMNDLWRYANGQWSWQSGSNTTNQIGVYGSKGTAASGNVPGARAGSAGWADSHGNLWLFGGFVSLSQNTGGDLNDLWTFMP
jgi:N-acetylneuraminic acid mutarotase